MKVLKFIFLLTLLAVPLFNDVSYSNFVLMTISTVVSFILFSNLKFSSNLGKYVIFLFVWISVVMMPALHLVTHISDYVNYDISQVDNNRILSFGSIIFLTVSIACLLFDSIIKKRKGKKREYCPRLIPERYIIIGFIIAFVLTAFSYVTGIAKMGGEPVYLPFHLGGIINLTRGKVAPIMFAVVFENYTMHNKKLPKKYFFLFFIWVIVEAFVCMSKGAIINLMLPLFFVYFFYYRPSIKQSARLLAPFVVIFLFLYPIIGIMRHQSGDFSESFVSARKTASEETGSVVNFAEINTILNRVFMTGFQYSVDYKYIDHTKVFDFSLVPALLAYRGAPGYQTHFIDGYPIDAINSSGTTGIMDPLLHGGVGLCIIIMIILVFFASIIDTTSESRKFSIYAQLIIMVWGFCNSNISKFYDPVGLPSLLFSFICLYITYRINFRRVLKNSVQIK